MPKISVIMPIYNVENYLAACLDSIVNQTLKDIEIICVNDGSTDNSSKILESFAKKDSRIIVIEQQHQGQGLARNNGLKSAKGEYVAFVDSDDWIEKDAFEFIYEKAKADNAEVIQFDYLEHNEYSGKIKEFNFCNFLLKNYKYDLSVTPYYNWKDVKEGCLHNLNMHVWTRVYSNDFVKKHNICFAPTCHAEDHLFVNMSTLNAEKIHYINKYFYNYRCRKGSSVNILSDDNFCIFENIELLKKYLEKNNLLEELQSQFKNYQIRTMAWHYMQITPESIGKYQKMCSDLLSVSDYKKMLSMAESKNTFLENIFSIKNKQEFEIKYKEITLLGIKFKLKPKKKD